MSNNPRVWLDWKKIDSLGGGGQSHTFKVRHRTDSRIGVLKLLKLGDGKSKDDTARLRFKREVKILNEIRHPNIVRLMDENVDAEPYFYVTPFGEPLNKWWVTNLPGVVEAQRIIRSLLEGLAQFHSKGGVHRDIKPANVVMLADENGQGRPVLIDFGLAFTTGDDHLTRPSRLVNNRFVAPPAALYGVYEDPPATWDCLGIAWLWAWMLAENPNDGYGRYHWRYHRFVNFDQAEIVRAVMAVCSTESLCPKDASSMLRMLDNLGLKPREESQTSGATGGETFDFRAASEADNKRHARELIKQADEVELKESAGVFILPIIKDLSDALKAMFARACQNLPLRPKFGDPMDVSRQGGSMLVECECGSAPPPPFTIRVHVNFQLHQSDRFLPFFGCLEVHHPRLQSGLGDPMRTSIRVEALIWDKEGSMWLGSPGERVVTIKDVVDLIESWLNTPEFYAT